MSKNCSYLGLDAPVMVVCRHWFAAGLTSGVAVGLGGPAGD